MAVCMRRRMEWQGLQCCALAAATITVSTAEPATEPISAVVPTRIQYQHGGFPGVCLRSLSRFRYRFQLLCHDYYETKFNITLDTVSVICDWTHPVR